MSENPHIPKFKVRGQISIYPKNGHVDPQVYILGIVSCQIRVQKALKPPEVWSIFMFFGKFLFLFTSRLQPQRYISGIIVFKNNGRRIKKLFCQSSRRLSA